MTAWVRVQLLHTTDVLADVPAEPSAWMTVHELQRLDAMSAPARRDSFVAGHWQARRLAAQALQVETIRIGMDAHPDGRPRLLLDAQPAPLQLSLSHGADCLALAVSEQPVGVDVELPRKRRDWLAVAGHVFSPDEIAQLHACEGEMRSALFHHYWALKEAHGKRSGQGLQLGQTRRFAACESAAPLAEAVSWGMGDGALALALQPGTRVLLEAAPMRMALHAPKYWCYRPPSAQEIGENAASG